MANPLIASEEIEETRTDPSVSPLAFQQEILAQFVEAGAGMFVPEWFRHFRIDRYEDEVIYILQHAEEVRRIAASDVAKFVTVDLAVSEKTTAHFTVISTWGVTPTRELLLLDCDRFRAEGPDIVPRIWDNFRRWHPSYVAIERVGYQLAIVQQASREGLPVRELTPPKDKVTRALTAQAYMEKSKIWFPHDAPWLRDIETEVLQFPVGEFDDFVDTMSYAAAELASDRFEPVVSPVGISQTNPWRI
jgi:predicted phage terminase large subunit-like protein